MTPSFFLRSALALALLLASRVGLADVEADLRAEIGYDSNPYNLSDVVGEQSGAFTALDARAGVEREAPGGGSIGLDAGFEARLFASRLSDASQEHYFVRVRGESGGRRRDHVFEGALRYRVRDATYVSRFTGAVATSGTTTIGDRYNSGNIDLSGAWHLPGARWGRVALEATVESKDYVEDYATLGLDRLDYMQFGLEPQYEYERGPDSVRVRLPIASRAYRDRRISDAAGAPVAGSDLRYTYYGFEARYAREASRTSEVSVGAGYEIREDNGVGYRDRERWQAGMEWTHRRAKAGQFNASVEYSARVLDRPDSGDPLINDETPEKEGYTLALGYVRPLPGVAMKDLSLLATASWESFDNSNDARFAYDRYEVFAGVRKRF